VRRAKHTMNTTTPSTGRNGPPKPRPRPGQTLVEFSLTLPLLLLLLFGIIEFGRIFQAWVTLQNAARAAARVAITGEYDKNMVPEFGSTVESGRNFGQLYASICWGWCPMSIHPGSFSIYGCEQLPFRITGVLTAIQPRTITNGCGKILCA